MASQPQPRKFFRYLLSIFLLLSLGIWLIGYIYYVHQVRHVKEDKQNDLAAITDLKIQQIVNWRNERLSDARVILGDQFLAGRIQDYLQGQGSPALEDEILSRLSALMIYHFQKIILIGRRGEVELCYPPDNRVCDSVSKKLVAEAMQRQEIIFSDLYQDDVSNQIRLSLLVPILSPKKDRALVGVILLKIDPHQFLYPLIQTWPTPSNTAETLLLRRTGNEVVFLNELRHQPDCALTLSYPLDTPRVCATLVAGKGRSVIDGLDYRKRWVMAAGARIPDSPWFLVAKVDRQEIFAPLATYVRQTVLLLVALMGTAAIGMAYVWRNQQAAFYRRQFEIERDRAMLAQRYAYLNKYANDIILLADLDLKLLEANDRAVESYGFEREELLRLSLRDLHPPEDRPLLEEKLREAATGAGLLFETRQQCKDGIPFPVEISLNLMEIAGQKFYQAIIRDVTKRQRAEEALRRSEASLAEAQRLAHLGRWEWDIRENKEFWSDEAYRNFGLKPQESFLAHETFLSFIHPEDLPAAKQQVEIALKSGQFGPYDFRIVRRDGSIRFLNSQGQTYFDSEGRPLRMVGTAQDVTERKLAEEALRRSEASLVEAQRIARLGRWEWDIRQDQMSWNDEAYRIFGLEPQEMSLNQETVLSLTHPDDQAAVMQQVNVALRSGMQGPFEFRVVWRDGSIHFLQVRGETTFDSEGRPLKMVGTAQDITALKRAEEALRESEEKLRGLTTQLLTAQEDERRRISVALHDDLGQALMVFRFQLSTLRDRLRQDHSPLSRDCEEMLEYVDGLLNQVRQLSQDLNPPGVLAELGFEAALKYLLEEFGKHYALQKCSLELADIEPRFSRQSLVMIYRVFQEALTNIGRHAQATRVFIKIKRHRDQVSFLIRDNGQGFDMAQVLGKSAVHFGIGLPSMQERVRMLGGTLEIWSRKGAGTRLSFNLPVENP